jgi:hypothetical protein
MTPKQRIAEEIKIIEAYFVKAKERRELERIALGEALASAAADRMLFKALAQPLTAEAVLARAHSLKNSMDGFEKADGYVGVLIVELEQLRADYNRLND